MRTDGRVDSWTPKVSGCLIDARRPDEADGAAEKRMLEGAGRRMHHDPRAMAVLFGWMNRPILFSLNLDI